MKKQRNFILMMQNLEQPIALNIVVFKRLNHKDLDSDGKARIKNNMKKNKKFKFIDLFAGVGGIRIKTID